MSEAVVARINELLGDDDKLAELADKHFTDYDADKSGFLDKTEVAGVFKIVCSFLEMDDVPESHFESAWSFIETNGDGKISNNEFRTFIKKILEQKLESVS